jgi:peptidoglycan/xylan/chitin deacetylase (PgdA/CDA1 family)
MSCNKLKRLLNVLTALIISISFAGCSKSKNTFDSAIKPNNSQLLSDKSSTQKEKTPEPTKLSDNDKKAVDDRNPSAPTPRRSLDPLNVKIPVLMYHSINPKSTNSNITTPEEFEKQMKWLKDNNFTTLSLDEVYSMITTGKNVPERPIALTFDDGYEDSYQNAYPILKKYDFKATVFLITDAVGQPGVLNEQEIREMYSNNIDFQSHTATHHELDKLTYQQQLNELTRSKDAISRLLNKNVDSICYPVGKFNDDTITTAKSAGYKMGFTTKHGHAKQSDGLYTLTRVRMSPGFNMQALNTRK